MVTVEKIKDIEPDTILNLRDVIKTLLEEKEELRENDLRLVFSVWVNFLIIKGLSDGYGCSMEEIQPMLETIVYCFQLAEMFSHPSYDSITRIRRDIQRKHPELQPSEPIKKLRKERQERIKKMFETERKRDKLNEWLEEGEQLKHE